ncbi:catalase [Xylaria palmicola]|nr:catalase [Xylaria palmicola]
MDEDWQEAAFTSRHVHNCVNRGGGKGREGKGKSKAAFDVRKTFGTYSLDATGTRLISELRVPGVIEAALVMAGSRKALRNVVKSLEEDESAEGEDAETAAHREDHTSVEDGDSEGSGEMEGGYASEEAGNQRFRNFEKNSFRVPKFWLAWAATARSHLRPCPKTTVTNLLYIT